MSEQSTEPSKKQWLEYQELAARIYAELQPYARVTHDDRILGHDSGSLRQIDVSIRTSIAGHDVLIIVQAKDLRRKVDVNAVGELAQVMRDVRAAKAVLVSNAGFSRSAVRFAKSAGIDLCSLHDAQSAKWPLSLSIPLLWIERHPEVELEFALRGSPSVKEDVTLSGDSREWIFSRDGGVTTHQLFEDFARSWNDDPANRERGRLHEWRPDLASLSLRVAPDVWLRVEELVVRYQATARGWLGSLRLADCRGIMNQSTDTLSARVTMTNHDIPLVKDPSWPTIDDPDSVESRLRELIVVECPEITLDSLRFHRFAAGVSDRGHR